MEGSVWIPEVSSAEAKADSCLSHTAWKVCGYQSWGVVELGLRGEAGRRGISSSVICQVPPATERKVRWKWG